MCSLSRMAGARHYAELAIWKMGDQLRVEVFRLTARPPFARDFKAQGQADDAVNSVCRNIAEGFACETHREFAQYLSYSRRSLNEVRDAMRGARQKGYVSATDLKEIQRLAFHLRPALSRFIDYLRQNPDAKNRPRTRRPSRAANTPAPRTPRTK
jgi:four helix bundle protein